MKLIRSIIVAALLLAAAATPAFAAGKAKMTADSVTYNYDLKKVVANGHVALDYDDIKLTADYVEIDLNENSLLAKGSVKLHDKQRDASGEVLVYDLDTRVGAFQGMRGQFTDDSIVGPVYIRSEGATVADNEYMLKNAWLTTCDLENPHYHIEADEIEIYLNQQIVLRHVRYYEGRYRLISLPYLVIPLNDDGVGLQAPKIGYTPGSGISIQLAYGYVINDRQSGTIHLDMQQSGMGFGVDHRIRIGDNFTGTLGAYELMNNSTTHIDWRLNAGAEQTIGKLKLNLTGKMDHQVGISDFVDGEYNLYQARGAVTGTTGAGPVNLSVDFRHSDLSTENYLYALGNTSLKWDGGYTLSVNGSFRYRTAYSPTADPLNPFELKTDRFADYSIRAGKAWDWGSLSAVFEERMNLEDPDASLGVTRQPELKLVVPKLAIPVLGPFDLNVGFGRFSAPQNSSTVAPGTIAEPIVANRTNVEIGRQALSYTAGGFNLTLGGRVRGSYYDTEQYLLSEVATLTWNQKYVSWLRTTAAFSWTALQGDTPFEFDRQTPGGSVSGGLFIEHKVVQASITTGYDFLTQDFRTISGRLRLNVSEGDYLQLAGSYNPNDQTFGYVLFEGNMSGKAGHLKANVQFNPNNLTFDHTDVDASVTLFEKLILEGQISFAQSFQYDAATLAIGYDWHCRQIKASYNFATNSFQFQLIFKAFPTKAIGFGG